MATYAAASSGNDETSTVIVTAMTDDDDMFEDWAAMRDFPIDLNILLRFRSGTRIGCLRSVMPEDSDQVTLANGIIAVTTASGESISSLPPGMRNQTAPPSARVPKAIIIRHRQHRQTSEGSISLPWKIRSARIA